MTDSWQFSRSRCREKIFCVHRLSFSFLGSFYFSYRDSLSLSFSVCPQVFTSGRKCTIYLASYTILASEQNFLCLSSCQKKLRTRMHHIANITARDTSGISRPLSPLQLSYLLFHGCVRRSVH